MKDIVRPYEGDWTLPFECKVCKTTATIEESDVQYDRFKPPGTYWFDGSAGNGIPHYFVKCPECDDLSFVDEQAIPKRIRDAVSQKKS